MGRSAAAGVARMRAWRAHCYGPPAELRLEEARVPALRAPDHLLVRVRTASINPLDVAMIGGYGARVLNALRSLEGVDVEFPLVVGRDFCGDVAQAGSACTFRTGRRVWGVLPPHWPGSHAQYVVVRDRWVGEAPSALGDLEAGGALYAALSACAALRAAGLPPRAATVRRPAPRVLLLGLGGVGHAALQLLQYSGAQVVVGCASELCPRALALGAVAALDRHAEDYDRALEELGPYDAILDCAGLGGAAAGARRWQFARYVTLSAPLLREADARGLLPGAASAVLSLAAHSAAAAWGSAAGVTGGAGTCRAAQVRWAFFSPSGEDIQLLRRLADDGKFAVAVERAYPWWAGGAAYERAAAGSARGKLLLDFTAAPRDAPGAVAQ
ncbi:reticulon-4-interacting protein 1, mitochondrial-like isoform X1 [Battus philenor]|uniref:reticulon-4-interacting protein 1, mitochondrial-like isoform X1 n=1 Tax=Battus philenor TaxID=42288 RepID=UPI0035CF6C2B